MRSRKTHRGLIDLRGGPRPKAPDPITRREPELGVIRFRRSPLRAKRRKKQAMIWLGVCAVLAAIGYGIHAVSYLPQLTINDVRIEGVNDLSPHLVRTYVESVLDDGSYHVLARDNIFIYPKGVIERAVATYFPRIQSVTLSRESLLAQAVTVTVVERSPYATWCADSSSIEEKQCYVFDNGGFIFAETSSSTEAAATRYVFTGGVDIALSPIGERVAGAHIDGLIALLALLESEGYAPLGLDIVDERDFAITLETGFTLKASRGTDPQRLAHNLELVLASDALRGKTDEIEYVDLRFGNRVYYKLLSEAESSYGSEEEQLVQ